MILSASIFGFFQLPFLKYFLEHPWSGVDFLFLKIFHLRFISFALAAVGLFWATMGMPEACGDAEGDVSVSAIWGILRWELMCKCP